MDENIKSKPTRQQRTRRTKTFHGHTANNGKHSLEYWVWANMWQRCTNPKTPMFSHYGGRGISVCPEWNDFTVFLRDVGPRPSREYSLDRFPNKDGNYEPNNVRWATKTEQSRNSRRNRILTAFNKTQTLAEWALESSLSRKGLEWRLDHGVSLEDALTLPRRPRNEPNGRILFPKVKPS